MADDVDILPSFEPEAVAVATDEIAGRHYQKVKLTFGPDGTATDLEDAGGVRLPVHDPIYAAATASDEGDEAVTDEAIAAPAADLRLMGLSARETTENSRAIFSIHRGTATTDPVLVTVSLGAGESTREWYGPEGLEAAAGIYLQRVSGAVQVIGYYKTVTP